MELKVWVEGIQRIVCGVTVNTTCQDVVFALAHATGKVGRFTLIERWRNNERLLGPNENPLKLLLKWGEYANDVQFILQRSENKQQQINNNSNTTTTPMDTTSPNSAAFKKPLGISNANNSSQPINDKMKEIKHNFGENENIGIVRGIPQRVVSPQKSQQQQKHQSVDQIVTSPIIRQQPQMKLELENASPVPIFTPKHEKSHSNPVEMTNSNSFKFYATDFAICDGVGGEHNKNNIYHQLGAQNSKSINEINLAEVRSALDRRVSELNDSVENNNKNTSSEYLLDVYNMNTKSYNNAPTISANGALVPPPYRDPPPPRNSPQQKLITNPFLNEEYKNDYNKSLESSESVFPAAQYKDLLQLIKFQRDKISTQQVELSKYDAEIVFLENKERDQAQELEAISREITKADQILRQGSDQLQTLQYVEEENELVKQQEKTLKSEITLLRSKLTNCETELMQCKNKIRLLMDDIELEQRKISTKEKNYRQNMERDFLIEMERIQSEIDQAIQSTDTSNKTAENLKKEIVLIENAIAEKKRQVEQLVNEMKEVNLQSLTVTTSEEIKHLFEGNNKPGGSSRRILGSPRQLENAVPTSKNPHGVWV